MEAYYDSWSAYGVVLACFSVLVPTRQCSTSERSDCILALVVFVCNSFVILQLRMENLNFPPFILLPYQMCVLYQQMNVKLT
eukprot:scaffold317237_cov27-Prasinocladus_malaysianus.AAC.2